MTEQDDGQTSGADYITGVLNIVNELAQKSMMDDYLYRGEPECYPKVSSSLYREYPEFAENYDISMIQEAMLEAAKDFVSEIDESDLLTQLQHFGCKTNLIDFTTDYHIALFFACDGQPEDDGRVIFLREADYQVMKPKSPTNRVIAQKSIFVQPPKGFIEPSHTVDIPHALKGVILEYLHRGHGVNAASIYTDIHGFIRYQRVHELAYAAFYDGFNHWSKGEYLESIECYSKAIELNPAQVAAYVNRGITYSAMQDYDSAIQDYDRALELNPISASNYFARGRAYASKRDYVRALLDFDQAIKVDHSIAEFYDNRGMIYVVFNDYDLALQDFNEAIELDPRSASAHHNRGWTYRNKGEYQRAIEDFDRAIELNSRYALAYYSRGESRLCMEDWEKAASDFFRAQQLEFDVATQFQHEFGDVAAFEQKLDIKLPANIAAMLTGPQ